MGRPEFRSLRTGTPATQATSMAFWSTGKDWQINLPRFQVARPDHVRVESSSCCFPRELVSFVRPGELVSFDPWHVLLQSENVF